MRNTKALIADAFAQLLEEKPYRRITVRDIVERCGVNRNTFYRYYQDIPSLLQALVQEKGDWLIENYCRRGQPMHCIRPLIQYSLEHRRAVLHVYRSLPREEFQTGLARIAEYLVEGATSRRPRRGSPSRRRIVPASPTSTSAPWWASPWTGWKAAWKATSCGRRSSSAA